jgi:hypothetical protein
LVPELKVVEADLLNVLPDAAAVALCRACVRVQHLFE